MNECKVTIFYLKKSRNDVVFILLFILLNCFIFDRKLFGKKSTMDAVKLQQEFIKQGDLDGNYICKEQPVIHRVPVGYMTGEEFVKACIEDIDKFCKEHGLL
jgi:regulatory protein YycI of two-component signal transduction system YycFG